MKLSIIFLDVCSLIDLINKVKRENEEETYLRSVKAKGDISLVDVQMVDLESRRQASSLSATQTRSIKGRYHFSGLLYFLFVAWSSYYLSRHARLRVTKLLCAFPRSAAKWNECRKQKKKLGKRSTKTHRGKARSFYEDRVEICSVTWKVRQVFKAQSKSTFFIVSCLIVIYFQWEKLRLKYYAVHIFMFLLKTVQFIWYNVSLYNV